ncbi:hypothetical protein BIW11_09730, partial [Tropilaelaps mercedesae]
MRSTASPSGVASPRRAEDLAQDHHFSNNMKSQQLIDKVAANSRARSPAGLSVSSVEPVQTANVLEVASLVLYGTCAIPVRLKILLDRLLAALQHEDVKQVLGAFGWTYDDYLRGYIAQ